MSNIQLHHIKNICHKEYMVHKNAQLLQCATWNSGADFTIVDLLIMRSKNVLSLYKFRSGFCE